MLDALQVESQAAVGGAEAHDTELAGVGVDPLAIDAEDLGDPPRVDVSHRCRGGVAKQLGDALGDRLDVLR
ncbi:MAG: hypothetical protein ACRDLN_00770 [Solirubrobacteraceae bacterium]